MKLPPALHGWCLGPAAAIALQRRLAGQIERKPLDRPPRWIAGCDAAFTPDEAWCLAAVVLWDLRHARVAESHTARVPLRFPYVPGLLSFREAPALLAALRRLRQVPDILMVDGQGLAHPRRFGLACHLGLCSGLPALGCAKSRLIGHHEEPGPHRGDRSPLLDATEEIGAVLRTRDRVRPVYVSLGHRLSLDDACQVVLASGAGRRLPEPTRLADRLVAAFKRSLLAAR